MWMSRMPRKLVERSKTSFLRGSRAASAISGSMTPGTRVSRCFLRRLENAEETMSTATTLPIECLDASSRV